MVVFLDPGCFTARLQLEKPSAKPDGQGGAAITWQVTATLWARIEPVSQHLGDIASASAGSVTHRIWTRFRDDIAAGDRLRRGARVFRVELVADPDETRRYIACRCQEEK